jgi:hypothetical protein
MLYFLFLAPAKSQVPAIFKFNGIFTAFQPINQIFFTETGLANRMLAVVHSICLSRFEKNINLSVDFPSNLARRII